jgi:hypothetical protein
MGGTRLALVALLGIILLVVEPVRAQVATGIPPFSSVTTSTFDTVNNANLNVHFEIPVVVKAGRGIPFSYVLNYDSSVWSPVLSGGKTVWTPVQGWGWRGVTEVATGYVYYNTVPTVCLYHGQVIESYNVYNNWAYHDPFGIVHPFNITISNAYYNVDCPNLPPSPQTAETTDGSGYTLAAYDTPAAYVYPRTGGSITAPLQSGSGSGTVTDSNGNTLSASSSSGTTTFTDTLASTALTVTGSGTPSSPLELQYTNPLGTQSMVKLNYTTATVQTNFGCGTVTDYGATQQNLVSSLSLPDGTSYSFTYEPTPGNGSNTTGRLASVTLPTGGVISYLYKGSNNGITCTDGSTATLWRSTPDTGSNYWE